MENVCDSIPLNNVFFLHNVLGWLCTDDGNARASHKDAQKRSWALSKFCGELDYGCLGSAAWSSPLGTGSRVCDASPCLTLNKCSHFPSSLRRLAHLPKSGLAWGDGQLLPPYRCHVYSWRYTYYGRMQNTPVYIDLDGVLQRHQGSQSEPVAYNCNFAAGYSD